MGITISIAVLNRLHITTRCLDSLLPWAKENLDSEVIIIDNFSNTKTTDYITKVVNDRKGFPKATAILAINNLGFGGAHNKAAKLAKCDYFMMVNNDVVFPKNLNWHIPIIKALKSKVKLVGAGGAILSKKFKGTSVSNNKGYNYLEGYLLCMKSLDARSFGPFSMKFWPGYGEDVDLCFRVIKSGGGIRRVPIKGLRHDPGGLRSLPMEEISKICTKHRQINLSKWGDNEKVNYIHNE